jgi:alginate O-acetyltransferase complex protein AlgI
MSFVSIEFLILFLVLFAVLAIFKQLLIRKLALLFASCVFYAWWDWRFLGILAAVTLLDYYISKLLADMQDPVKRKALLWVSILINLGFLGIFKYFNFFVDSLNLVTAPFGWRAGTLDIILPIGISFYTFETLSYVIDVYKGVTQPARSLLDYAIFITFFPRLVAGPIMRASEFLPQLERGIHLNGNNLVEGAQLFLRGMLKKLVIADNMAVMVDYIYNSPSLFSSPTVWLTVFAYSIQILYDFWGYTDMARGLGRMLGIELPLNFDAPYTSQSMTEFWSRWHISLSTWLRDYVYIPLGGNRKGTARTYINIMITMLLGGLWHGASWNFILWGGLHGVYLILERMFTSGKPAKHSWTSYKAWLRALLILLLVTITWVPFRSPDWQTTLLILGKLLFIEAPYHIEWYYAGALLAVPVILVGGWVARRFEWKWPILPIQKSYTPAFMLFQILIIYFFAPLNASPFIYFQF